MKLMRLGMSFKCTIYVYSINVNSKLRDRKLAKGSIGTVIAKAAATEPSTGWFARLEGVINGRFYAESTV